MYSPAYKVKAEDLIFGKCESEESGISLVTPWGARVKKVRILGTVVNRYVKEDGSYAFISLDDGSGVVRVKAWREDVKMIEPFKEGDIVDVIGRVRLNERDGEVYIVPDLVIMVSDPNVELLRELEIIEERLKLLGSGMGPRKEGQTPRDAVIGVLMQGEPMSVEEISRATGIPVDRVNDIIEELLAEGRIAEKDVGKFGVV